MAGTQAPSGLRSGGTPPTTSDPSSTLPGSPSGVHNVGDAFGAKVTGGRGPSLNGAPVVGGSAPEVEPISAEREQQPWADAD